MNIECFYCHRPIKDAMASVKVDGEYRYFHILVDEHGSKVNPEWCCFRKSENGRKAL